MTAPDTALELAIEKPLFHAEELHISDSWSGYLIPLNLPIKDRQLRAELNSFLWDLAGSLFPPTEAQQTVWLLMDNLHRDNEVLNLSRNAREWKPTYGLGLWPDKEPPRMTTREDILDMEWGSKPRLPYHSVAMLNATGVSLRAAWNTMFGTGSTILTLGPGGGSSLLKTTREYLKTPITDESFQDFPFYFPLLGRKSLQRATASQMDGWLGTTQLYLRESEEDHSVLLLARVAQETLRAAIDTQIKQRRNAQQ